MLALTLDDVARLVQDAIHRERRSMKQLVNDALRRAPTPVGDVHVEPYRLVPHESGPQPGIDVPRLNSLADELDDERFLDRLADVNRTPLTLSRPAPPRVNGRPPTLA
jgi:hypothetical protein